MNFFTKKTRRTKLKGYTGILVRGIHSRGSPITSPENIFTTDRKIAIRYRVRVTTKPLHISSNDLAVSRNLFALYRPKPTENRLSLDYQPVLTIE